MHVQLYYSFSPLVVGHYQCLYSKYQSVLVALFPFRYKIMYSLNSVTLFSAK